MLIKKRNLQTGYAAGITIRCNNREFKLQRSECREVFLYCLKQAIEKYKFKLYAVCIMSNHIHYLIEPIQPDDLPKIMHFLNWYTAMSFNRMLNEEARGRGQGAQSPPSAFTDPLTKVGS